jgi:DNA-binding transcriptional MerR regulator
MTDEIVYSASEVYKRLGISDSTLRKYMEVLSREGFAVKKDNRGRRQYTDSGIMVIEKLIELSKHDGMTLEKAAKMIAQQIGKVNPDLIQEEATETDLVPFHIKQQLQEQYSVMAQEMNQSMLAMEQAKQSNEEIKASVDAHNERVEKRLEAWDETLMKTLREIQETKRLMQEFRYEVAAAKGVFIIEVLLAFQKKYAKQKIQ